MLDKDLYHLEDTLENMRDMKKLLDSILSFIENVESVEDIPEWVKVDAKKLKDRLLYA